VHLAIEGGRNFLLQIGAEAIDVDKQRDGDDDQYQYTDNNPGDDEQTFHGEDATRKPFK
jgi:hypothetical protein